MTGRSRTAQTLFPKDVANHSQALRVDTLAARHELGGLHRKSLMDKQTEAGSIVALADQSPGRLRNRCVDQRNARTLPLAGNKFANRCLEWEAVVVSTIWDHRTISRLRISYSGIS